jgi:HEAT repeat protein
LFRFIVAGALGQVADIGVLIEALGDKSARVRSGVAIAISNTGSKGKAAVRPLIKLLEDADADVRVTAARALGNVVVGLQDAKETEYIRDLEVALDILKKVKADVRDDQKQLYEERVLRSVSRVIQALKAEKGK